MATTRQVRGIIGGLQRDGFTRRQIASLTGLSRSSVSGLLSGRHGISPERATDVVERFARPAFQRSLEVVDDMRDGVQWRDATEKAHTTSGTVIKNVGPVLQRGPAGEWRARASDRLPRIMKALAPEGEVRVLVTDSKRASLIGQYGNAVNKWRETGDRRDLDRFEGRIVTTVQGQRVPLVTDEAALRRLSDAGEFVDMDDIYG